MYPPPHTPTLMTHLLAGIDGGAVLVILALGVRHRLLGSLLPRHGLTVRRFGVDVGGV
jgi:hypothetical protein